MWWVCHQAASAAGPSVSLIAAAGREAEEVGRFTGKLQLMCHRTASKTDRTRATLQLTVSERTTMKKLTWLTVILDTVVMLLSLTIHKDSR